MATLQAAVLSAIRHSWAIEMRLYTDGFLGPLDIQNISLKTRSPHTHLD